MARVLVEIADEIRAIATTGLHFGHGPFDLERYQKLLALAAKLVSAAGAGPVETLERIYTEADRGYTTPKLDVRLAVFRGDEILLVRERSDGLWCMPGGFVDIGDTPSEAAIREMQEEAGVATRVSQLVGIFDNRLQPDVPPHLFHIYKLLFLGELVDPDRPPRPGPEIDAAGFHPLAGLPELSRGRTLPLHIAAAHEMFSGTTHRSHFD
jgi:ADP-ribose pyrophosphatase YjhB (NUDIX family)